MFTINLSICLIIYLKFNVNSHLVVDLHENYLKNEWNQFKDNFDKSYENEDEELFRFNTFSNNLKLIENHNLEYENGKHTYTMGLNEYSDMTDDEFDRIMLMNQIDEDNDYFDNMDGAMIDFFAMDKYMNVKNKLPKYVDWRKIGAVTDLKVQHRCGACWAFAATGAIEAQYFLKTNKLISFSEQNLIDCTQYYGTHGCHGGYAHLAFGYLIYHKLHTEHDYPYSATKLKCRYMRGLNITLNGFQLLDRGNEDLVKMAVALHGPVAISYRVTRKFRHHNSGIFYQPNCTDHTNHAMLIVGYGTENGKDYWLVKNTWGYKFGVNGYGKIARNMNNNCGVARRPVIPFLK